MKFAPATLTAAFDHRVRHDRDRTFLMVPDGAALTFGEANDQAARLGRMLTRHGIGPGSRVGLHLLNDPTWISALLAVWRRGAEAVILSGLLRPAELSPLLQRTRPDLVLSTEDLRHHLPAARVHRLSPRWWTEQTGSAVEDDPAQSPPPEQAACVFLTSGTTGVPKPVVHTHGELASAAAQMAAVYPRTPGFRDRAAPERVPPGIIFYPFGHVAGLHALAFRLWVGRRVVLARKFSVDALEDLVRRYRVDALQLVPAMLHELAETPRQVDLSGVAYITTGTAPLSQGTRAAFEKRFGVPVLATYGSTETGPVAHVRYSDMAAGRLPEGSVGRAAPGVEVRFAAENGDDAPAGTDGELQVRKGGAGGHWIGTGDIGHADDKGFLFITGRRGDMMIVGGFNVFPEEIERAIDRTGLVRGVVVVAQPDARLGQVPIAGVVGASAAQCEQLLVRLRGELAAYKIPRRIVAIDAVPLTARQKVDRRAAERLLARSFPPPGLSGES